MNEENYGQILNTLWAFLTDFIYVLGREQQKAVMDRKTLGAPGLRKTVMLNS